MCTEMSFSYVKQPYRPIFILLAPKFELSSFFHFFVISGSIS